MSQLPYQEKKREVLVRVDEPTSDKFGSRPENRTMQELIDYGVICLDKPPGPTSHQVSAYTKQILGVPKTGHSGSLDPNVTGILVIASGRATRIAESLLKAGKEYVCVMHIHESVPKDKIISVMKKFEGKIKQLPPLKSAVKRQLRFRKVYYNDIIEISPDCRDVLFRTGVQAGTYIRKLVHDIGQDLGCGAHMAELRRTRVATFGEETNMCTLHDLKDAFTMFKQMNDETLLRKYIMPVERAVEFLPKIWLRDSAVNSICHGANLNVPGIAKVETGIEPDLTVALMTQKDELVAVGTAKINAQKMQRDERGFAVKVDKVFMLPDTYPKMV